MKNVKKSKAVSGSGIYAWGGTLDDLETSHNYQISYNIYFVDVYDTVQTNYIQVVDLGSDTYDKNMGAIPAYSVYF